MPYQVIADRAIDILNDVGELTHPFHPELRFYEHESNVWLPEEIIPDEEISPVVVDKYDDGDEHIRSLIKRVGKPRAEKPKADSAKADEE